MVHLAAALVSFCRPTRVLIAALACVTLSACATPEDPARVARRGLLTQETRLSAVDLDRFREAIRQSLTDARVRVNDGAGLRELSLDERQVVFGMLTDPAGMYDEGLRQDDGARARVLNAPGVSTDMEIEASRRLWVDVETFLPRRFDFTYAFAGHGDYSFQLVVER